MAGNFRKGLRFPNGIPRVETNRGQVEGCVNEMSDNQAETDIAAATVAHNGGLRDRIAYAIAQADGDLPGMEPASCDYEMADAVIEDLGLRKETVYAWNKGLTTRYVTEWRNDE